MTDHVLPAYLQSRTVQDFTDYASDGLGAALPPHVSIRGNIFTLVDAGGQEFEPLQQLDCVIVDRSNFACKRFYPPDKPWTPNSDDPPLCWSTNGVGPSINAPIPQARTCVECPNNVRGSAVSKISGASIKACRDEFHMAILLPTMPDMMFQFVLTPGSFDNWQAYTAKFKNSNVRISMVVTRMSFVPKINGVIEFASVAYVDEATNGIVVRALAEKATDLLVGRLDTPRVAAIAAPAVHGHVQQQPGQTEDSLPPLRMGASGGQPVQQTSAQVQQPGPFDVARTAGNPSTNTATPSTNADPAPGASTTPPSAPAQGQRRRRRTAAEMQAANGAAPAQASPQPAATGGAPLRAPFPNPGQQGGLPGTGQQTTQVPPNNFGIAQGQPAGGNPEVSAMLDDFFGKG
jgi:hypothetical protein